MRDSHGLAKGPNVAYGGGNNRRDRRKHTMTILAFDTLKAARNLGKAGFNEAQIDSLLGIFAEALTENLATKDDIGRIDAKIDASVESLQKDIGALDAKIDATAESLQKDIGALDAKIDTVAKRLDTKIDTAVETLRKDLIIKLGGIVIGTAAAIEIIDRFF